MFFREGFCSLNCFTYGMLVRTDERYLRSGHLMVLKAAGGGDRWYLTAQLLMVTAYPPPLDNF